MTSTSLSQGEAGAGAYSAETCDMSEPAEFNLPAHDPAAADRERAVVCLGLPGTRRPPPRALLRGDLLFYGPDGGAQAAMEFTAGFPLADGGDEPCCRTATVGPEWTAVEKLLFPDFGRPSLIAVENLHDADRQRRPTEEEARAVAAHVVEVGAPGEHGIVTPFAWVRPGRALPPVEPAGPLLLRCAAGPCRVRVVALPPLDPAVYPDPPAAPATPPEAA